MTTLNKKERRTSWVIAAKTPGHFFSIDSAVWFDGFMVLWFDDFMVWWFYGWWFYGFVVWWFYGLMILWLMVLWFYGFIVLLWVQWRVEKRMRWLNGSVRIFLVCYLYIAPRTRKNAKLAFVVISSGVTQEHQRRLLDTTRLWFWRFPVGFFSSNLVINLMYANSH